MELLDYQTEALKTAQPRAFEMDYLVPMIVGEVGELFGQRAKAHWHGWAPERLQGELVSELGDVAWGTAILLHTAGRNNVDHTALNPVDDPWQILLNRSHYLYMFYQNFKVSANQSISSHTWLVDEARMLWKSLEMNAEFYTDGICFEDVLQANLDKLASRAARGVLQGQGDHR